MHQARRSSWGSLSVRSGTSESTSNDGSATSSKLSLANVTGSMIVRVPPVPPVPHVLGLIIKEVSTRWELEGEEFPNEIKEALDIRILGYQKNFTEEQKTYHVIWKQDWLTIPLQERILKMNQVLKTGIKVIKVLYSLSENRVSWIHHAALCPK